MTDFSEATDTQAGDAVINAAVILPDSLTEPLRQAFYRACLQHADDHLVIGHRLSEWCGHAPMLEEDLSMPNLALDLIGQARVLYQSAATLSGDGRSEDDLAYLRTDREYYNCLLVERPNGDFAHTMLRQFYFSVVMQQWWQQLQQLPASPLQPLAGKASKEVAYHVRHTGEWVVRLGDGTDESSRRMQEAVVSLHPYIDELFEVSDDIAAAVAAGWLPDARSLREPCHAAIEAVLAVAQCEVPSVDYPQRGGRIGQHTEDFGFLLAELQYLQRAYPGQQW